MDDQASAMTVAVANVPSSFLEAITLSVREEHFSTNEAFKDDSKLNTQPPSQNTNVIQAGQSIVVHRERLEDSSDFFRRALKNNWVEGKSKVIKVDVYEPAVLGAYGQWLYGKRTKQTSSWDFLVNCYLFGQTYCVDEFVQHTMACMVAKLSGGGSWIPSLEEIIKVYANTADGCGLRLLLRDCIWKARSSDAMVEVALREAPHEFQCNLLDTAMHHRCDSVRGFSSWPSPDDVDKYFAPYVCNKQADTNGDFFLSTLQDFENVVSFALTDSTRTGFIHLPSLGRTGSCKHFPVVQCICVCEPGTDASSFDVFASWLYFGDNLGEIFVANSASRGVDCLLDYYNAARCLLRVESLLGICPASHSEVDLVDLLHFQAARFKDEVVEALACTGKSKKPCLQHIKSPLYMTSLSPPMTLYDSLWLICTFGTEPQIPCVICTRIFSTTYAVV